MIVPNNRIRTVSSRPEEGMKASSNQTSIEGIGCRNSTLGLSECLSDKSYLLQACNKLDWKIVMKCCRLFLENFYNAEGDPEVTEICKQQLLSRDRWDNNLLHVVCYLHPSVEILENTLAIARISGLPLTQAVNDSGATPLLCACSTLASQLFIKTLLDYDNSNVTTCDSTGNTPLLCVERGYRLCTKLPHFKQHCLPLEEVNKAEVHSAYRYLEDHQSCGIAAMHCRRRVDSEEDARAVFPRFLQSVEDLIRAAWANTFPEEPFISMLHGAALVSGSMPKEMINMMVRVHKDKIAASTTVLPLHLTLLERLPLSMRIRRQHTEMVKALLELDSTAATKPLLSVGSTKMRCSTFNQAIARGFTWSLIDEEQGKAEQDDRGVLQFLHRASPDALQTRDLETGLFPFQLAATVAARRQFPDQAEDDEHSDYQDRVHLDTIFSLLRNCPQVVLVQQ